MKVCYSSFLIDFVEFLLVKDGGVDFHQVRSRLRPRPWVIDDVDVLLDKLRPGSYGKMIVFVDNSGSDVILGQLPLARTLLKAGIVKEVVMAANSHPSINDITFRELEELLPKVCASDDVLCDVVSRQKLRVVPSGGDLPVIDLQKVSPEVIEEACGTDLVLLDGMGRGIETNLNVQLQCDCINIAMVKHPEVAAAMSGNLLDCVVKFTPGIAKDR